MEDLFTEDALTTPPQLIRMLLNKQFSNNCLLWDKRDVSGIDWCSFYRELVVDYFLTIHEENRRLADRK